jgi:hypothetical protein
MFMKRTLGGAILPANIVVFLDMGSLAYGVLLTKSKQK